MREDGKKKPSPKVVKLFKRSWVFPAVYVLTAAVLLSGVFAYQYFMKDSATKPVDKQPIVQKGDDNPTLPVVKPTEMVKSPFTSEERVEITKPFYDASSTTKEQESSLVVYGQTYRENTGISYKSKDGKTFDVAASLSGTVTSVKEDNLLGVVVTIDHGNNIETLYQGLGKTLVEKGMKVDQGQVIGQAGVSELSKEDGIGVHFEVRKDGLAINPASVLSKNVATIDEFAKKMKEDVNVSAPTNDEEKPSEDKNKQE